MKKTATKDKILEKFHEYLDSLEISKVSHKNYRSDVSHFMGWLIFKLRSWGTHAENLTETVPYLKPELAKAYREYLSVNSVAESTINRRLSTLRHLGKFFLESQVLDYDFMAGVTNISTLEAVKEQATSLTIVESFESHLYSSRVSKSIAKNHIEDVEHLLDRLEKNHTELYQKNS